MRLSHYCPYTYDALNRLTGITVNYGAFTKTASYCHYPNGLKKTHTGPDGQTLSYGYDNNNQLQTVSIPGQGSITVNEYNWAAPQTITFPGGGKQNNSYDGYLRTTQIKTTDTASNALLDVQYQFDLQDNITSRNVLSGSATGETLYDYDAMERLSHYAGPGINPNTVDLSYDPAGNRTSDSRSQNNWQYDNRDRLTQRDKLTYSYDENGSQTQITHATNGVEKTFIYNLENRLTEVKDGSNNTIASYQYDPFGRRIAKTVNGNTTYYFYAQEGLVAEMDNAGNITTSYGYQPDSSWGTDPLYIKQGSQFGYYHNDHLGTPQQIATASGQIIWSARYDAFGEATIGQQTITNNLRFPGQYYDGETGLHYNNQRFYDPSTGRYITSDPIGLAGGVNSYVYAYSNPLSFVDPLGLWVPPSVPDWLVDGAAGFGDTISFGITDKIRDWMGTNGAVNKCSGAYSAGEWAGIGYGFAAGGLAGWRAAGQKAAGKEFSHWVPDRAKNWRGSNNKYGRRFLRNGNKWNGNYVTNQRHYKHDRYRYSKKKGEWRDWGPKWPKPIQQFDRIPNVYKGGAAGGGAAGSSAAGDGCGCQ